jgi:4-aminobutyrate aminotransferase / (S)-3-amino-2-methylpropionate transaminase / 5-aminovalerate transaminase
VLPPRGFLAGLRALATRRGALVIADEVMTGLGRTGVMFRSAAEQLAPDLLCLGKALGGGLPVSACLGRAEVMAAWGAPAQEALHTGTFFGNALGCAAALAALETIECDGLCARAARVGDLLCETLRGELGARVRAVRGAGLLLGVELESGARGLRVVRALLERGYIVVPASSDARVVSLTPPLTIDEGLLLGFVGVFARVLDEVAQ